jgi:hypothetical protein
MSLLKRYELTTFEALGKLLPPEITNMIAEQRLVDFLVKCCSFTNPLRRPNRLGWGSDSYREWFIRSGVCGGVYSFVFGIKTDGSYYFQILGRLIFGRYSEKWTLTQNEWVLDESSCEFCDGNEFCYQCSEV